MELELPELEVCQVTSKELVHDFILDYSHTLKWTHGVMDDELYWVSDSKPGAGLYIGRLNGQPITGVGMFQHNDSYAFIGFYFCKEEHRGKGYGYKTWKVAKASLSSELNFGLDAEKPASHLYEREGFKRAWDIILYTLSVSSTLKVYRNSVAIPEGVTIKPCADVNFQKLKSYTEDIIGFTFDRPSLLEKWISLPTHTALAAVTETGDIVGFAAIRESILVDEVIYRLAPLLADSGHIARVLLVELAKTVNPDRRFILSVLPELNPEAKMIVDEVAAVYHSINVRMYTKGVLPITKEKYFGTFSPNLTG